MRTQINSIKECISKLLYILSKKQKKQSVFLLFMIILGSFFEMLGVSAILPFINAILTPELVLNKWYVKFWVDYFNVEKISTVIIVIGIFIICVYIVKNIYLYFSLILQVSIRSRIEKSLSTKMLKAYMNKEYEYYVNTNTANVMRLICGDVVGVYQLLDNLFRLLGELFTAILISGFIFFTDWFMAICIIILAGLCFLGITLGLKKQLKKFSEQRRLAIIEREKCAYQAIMGFKEIKIAQADRHFLDLYDEAYEDEKIIEIKNEKIANIPEKLIEAICVSALIGVICIKVAMGAEMSSFIPKLGVFAVAAFRLLPSVSRMSRYANGISMNLINLNNVYNMLIELEIDSEEEFEYEKRDCQNNFLEFTNIEISNLEWNYEGNEKKVLDELSINIKKGEAIGIIGQSGAGKSTFTDCFLGLLKPKSGAITLDGVDVYTNLPAWSRMIGYVPQNVFLSDDTIRNNVAFGVNVQKINDNDVWKALEQAQLKEFVQQLPQGLETRVGERGIRFSGGQRQRVAIARALYHNPEIIVLDEATSALDNDTEKAVMEAIDFLQGKKTLIIVAHRYSTLKKCTKIYSIENGKAIKKTFEEISHESV